MYDYGYGYDYGIGSEAVDAAAGFVGLGLGLWAAMMIFTSIIGLIAIISYAKIFTKAGKPWWASIVPIYNTIVMIEIAKLPLWYIALFFVPIANVYAIFKINIEMAKKFGKGIGFGVGMTLLSIIFIPLLAFSDNKYEGDDVISQNENNQFDANNVINNNVSENNATVVAPVGNVTLENNPFVPVIDSVSVEPAPVSVEPVESIPMEPAPVSAEPVESIPMEPTPVSAEPAESILMEPTPVSAEPIENIPMEPTPVSAEPVESIPVEPAPVSVEPIESIPVEPAPVSAEPIENIPVEPITEVNAFNMAPETNIEPLVTETVNETIPELNIDNTIQLASNLAEDKKVCKNCGNELPDIVSICPNCGTDNE